MRKQTILIYIMASLLLTLTGCGLNNTNGLYEIKPQRTYRSIEELWLFIDDAHLAQSPREGRVRLTLQFADWYTEDMWDVSFFEGGGISIYLVEAPDDVIGWHGASDDDGNRLISRSHVTGGHKNIIEYTELNELRELTLEISESRRDDIGIRRSYFLQVHFADRFNPIVLNLHDIMDELRQDSWVAVRQSEGIYVRVTPPTDVQLIVKEVTPSGITFVFDNPTYSSYTFGFPYELFVRRGNLWIPVEPLEGQWFMFFLMGFTIAPQSTTQYIERSWESVAGVLAPGEYKFRTDIGRSTPRLIRTFDVIFTLQ